MTVPRNNFLFSFVPGPSIDAVEVFLGLEDVGVPSNTSSIKKHCLGTLIP